MENSTDPLDDEYDAASSLLLLSESNGGFCNPTISTHEEASTIKIETQKRACWMCDKVFQKGKAAAVVDTEHHQCSICHETFPTWQALQNHFVQSKLAGKASTNLPPPE